MEQIFKTLKTRDLGTRPIRHCPDDCTQANGDPTYGFQELLTHLATHSRNTVSVTGVEETFEPLAMPTTTQHRVTELIASSWNS